MIRLEVQKIDNSRLRINLYQDSETPSVVKTYQTVDLKGIEALLKEVTVQIPRQFTRTGADIELYEQLKSKAITLYQAILGDLGKILRKLCQPTSPIPLNILLDDEVNFIPFEILHTGDHFLWEGFLITRQIAASSGVDELPAVKNKRMKKMTLVGNPSDDPKLELTVRNELYGISGIWEDELDISGPHFGGTTSRYRLAELMSGADLFHFSGHYERPSDGEGPQDGWLLRDGTVFSEKDISSIQNPPQFLFSNSCGDLSALQSGGFIRALLHSGVRCVISTIGTVPTKQASYFSTLFYVALQEGKSAVEAISAARKSLVTRFGISDISWMFYSLYGDGGFTIRLSKTITIGKYRNRIKLALIGAAILLGIFMAKTGLELIKNREVRVTSSPASIRLKVNGELLGFTPFVCTVSSMDEIQLITEGYDTARYHLKKIHGTWQGNQADAPDYILSRGQLSPTHISEPGLLHVNLVPTLVHELIFENVGKSQIMIQGISGELTGKTFKLAIDGESYRFIISQNGDVFDKLLEVKEDTVIDVSMISTTWQKNRFR